jgi:putative oxidoreductase
LKSAAIAGNDQTYTQCFLLFEFKIATMLKKLLSFKPIAFEALAFIRIISGILILIHGYSVFDTVKMDGMAKYLGSELGLPLPLLMAYLAKCAEFFGGLLFVIGLFTRLVSIPLVITMAVAVFGAHNGEITGEAEHAFLFLLVFAAFFFIGSGKWSVDYLLKKRTGK